MQEDEIDLHPDRSGPPENYTEWVDHNNAKFDVVAATRDAVTLRDPVVTDKYAKFSLLVLPPEGTPPTANSGLRYDSGKPRFDLVPPEAMIELAAHYERGARKYADRNWERGMDWGKCFASMQRHSWAWAQGEDLDNETGTHHMIAVAWNAIALYTYAMRKIGNDDRVKVDAG
jgi:hypothetical protein